MSYPNIPDVNPSITLEREDVINLLLASIAFEELGLSHIINSEAEKIQYVLGTLPGHIPPAQATVDDLLKVDNAVRHILQDVIKKEMLLEFQLEDVLNIPSTSSTSSTATTTTATFTTTTATTTATTTETTTATTTETTTSATTTQTTTTEGPGFAWMTGVHYGGGNNQYQIQVSGAGQVIITNLGTGNWQSPNHIGTVAIIRDGVFNTLQVVINMDDPYNIDLVQINIESNIPPLTTAPEQFPNKYPLTPTNSFVQTIDIRQFAGQNISVAVHTHVIS